MFEIRKTKPNCLVWIRILNLRCKHFEPNSTKKKVELERKFEHERKIELKLQFDIKTINKKKKYCV